MPPPSKPIGLRIELEEVSPLIWRRVVVSDQWTLAALDWGVFDPAGFDLNRVNRNWRGARRVRR